jgi:quercetin dioxygenase-like cupin family protein
VQHWSLLEVPAPEGTRDPIIIHSGNEARAVLIVLKPGQALGEHQVKECAWVTVVEGSAAITTAGATIDAEVGTLVRFDPDERHAISSADGARVLLVLAPWPGEGHYRGNS